MTFDEYMKENAQKFSLDYDLDESFIRGIWETAFIAGMLHQIEKEVNKKVAVLLRPKSEQDEGY